MSNLPLPSRFTIRVYGLLLHDGAVLISHERIGNFAFTKFPGGGLEFGEGTIDCVKREFKEETGLTISNVTHYYTTDFFQQSAFKPQDQLMSIYYLVEADDLSPLVFDEQVLNTGNRTEHLRLEWVKLTELTEDLFTFPIDKLIANRLKQG